MARPALLSLLLLPLGAAAVASASTARKKGAPSYATPDLATQALFDGVDKGDVAVVRGALASGARIDENGPEFLGGKRQTPLMYASLIGETQIVRILLDAGADATIGEADGYTPLHGAAFQGRADTARALLAHGGVPNEAHKDGFHPIHRACWGKTPQFADTVQAFLDFGVSPTLLTEPAKGKALTPLEIARKTPNANVVRVLEAAIKALASEKGTMGEL